MLCHTFTGVTAQVFCLTSTGSSVVVELVAGITAAVEVGGRGDVGAVLLTARLPTPVPL